MKPIGARVLSAILCISILFSLFSCQKQTQKSDENERNEEPFTIDESYHIVRGEFYEKSEEIIASIQLLREASLEVFGKAPYLCDDKRRAGDTSVNEFEILVGETNREQSQATLKTLGVNDFTYYIESKNVIVICGGSPQATLEGVKQFCLDVLGYDAQTKQASSTDVSLIAGETFSYVHDYQYKNADINGVDVSDLVIAIKNDKQKLIGLKAASIFASLTGIYVPTIKYSELKGTEKAVVCIGAADRSGGKAKDLQIGYLVNSSYENDLLTIGVSVTDDSFYTMALRKLADNLTIVENGEGASVSLPAKQLCGTGYEDILPTWTLRTQRSDTISDGVIYSERLYVDQEGLPYRVYMLSVDTTKAYFYLGSYNDEYVYSTASDHLQTVADQIDVAIAKGLDVIAGTNVQFFGYNLGLAVKEGQVISTTPYQKPFLAYTKDARVYIGDDSVLAPYSQLQTAVSGSHYIVKNSLPYELRMDEEIGYISHPRTLIGLKEDGTVLIAVIDGRQEKHSNGAPLARCAEFMIDEGCVQAMNVDGGGSSTCIIRSGDKYVTKNSPSDGELRKLPVSLLIVKK